MPFFDSPGPLVFAHRGGCDLGPENTLAAFDLGLAAGADGLECDVHLSADGVPVVCHDDLLDRTTGSAGPISRLTAAELANVDAGCRFRLTTGETPFAGQGIGIPALRDVLDRYAGTRVIVEMKVDTAQMGERVAAVVREAGAVDRVCAAGYGLASLAAVRRSLPELATSASHPEVRMALYRSWSRWPVRAPAYGGYQVPEHAGRLRVVSRRFLRDAHSAGLKVHVWTVDEEPDMRRLLEWGVDGLISNRPDKAVRVRGEFVARSR
jgi:glycerophosphoryl diester phosphodiesterase